MFLYKTTPVACCCKAQVNGSCFVMELWDKAERLWTRVKNWKTVRGWHIWKLKLVDARFVFRQHVRRFADGTGRCALSLSSLLSVPPPQWFLRFASGLVLAHSTLSVFLGHSRLRHVARGENAAYRRGGIPQTRGVINGRIWLPASFHRDGIQVCRGHSVLLGRVVFGARRAFRADRLLCG